jgi:hypothetical protein
LRSAGITLPDHETANGSYFDAVTSAVALPDRLPAPLRAALLTLENAASAQNQDLMDQSIARRIPCVAVNLDCPLDRALELWFLVPDELEQFQPPAAAESVQCSVFSVQSTHAAPPSPASPSTINSRTLNSEVLPLTGSLTDPLTTSAAPNSQPSTLQLSTRAVPWPSPVDGKLLLDELAAVLRRFVVLPIWAAEALALWIVHTFAFQLRDVSAYIGIESPEKRCGKTTLLTLVSQLVNRPVVASNISPPAFFRVIEELRPTLLIDEADTFLRGNDELRGILNAGNKRETAFVVRVANQAASGPNGSKPAQPSSQLATYSSWCPKALATIDRLPDTLADRCIVVRMQRKTSQESCERLRTLDAEPLRRKCARFVADHSAAIAAAHPTMPAGLNDRATDIWEPLIAVADLAGGNWPELARQAAVSLAATAQETNPIGTLLVDIFVLFALSDERRMFSRTLIQGLITKFADRPWTELSKGKEITNLWLSQQLRPYGIKPRTIWIGDQQAKGYTEEDFQETFRRYIPRSELDAIVAAAQRPEADNSLEAKV